MLMMNLHLNKRAAKDNYCEEDGRAKEEPISFETLSPS